MHIPDVCAQPVAFVTCASSFARRQGKHTRTVLNVKQVVTQASFGVSRAEPTLGYAG